MIYRNGTRTPEEKSFLVALGSWHTGPTAGTHIGQGFTLVTQGLELNPFRSGLESNPCHTGTKKQGLHSTPDTQRLELHS